MIGEEYRASISGPGFGELCYQKFIEKYKYVTALTQINSNHLGYLKAVLLYGLQRKVVFPETVVNLYGSRFFARKNSMDVAHLSKFFEPQTTRFLLELRPGRFIDVGAHIGRYTILLAKNGSEVICFEPDGDNFRQLVENMELNKLQSIIKAFNLGCSDVSETRDLYCVPSNEGAASFIKKTGAEARGGRSLQPLDAVCGNMESIDVIKMDVEGFELKVLKGAKKILQERSPILLVEIFGPQEQANIVNFLSPMGYSIRGILDLRNFIFGKNRP
jgi:FkbM family methyltransferase